MLASCGIAKKQNTHLHRWTGCSAGIPVALFAGNLAGEGKEACEVLIANGATLPLGRLLLRTAKDRSTCAAHAAICAAWALSNLLFSCPCEVFSFLSGDDLTQVSLLWTVYQARLEHLSASCRGLTLQWQLC